MKTIKQIQDMATKQGKTITKDQAKQIQTMLKQSAKQREGENNANN